MIFIKTLLKINDDLKDYLKEAINRGESDYYKAYSETFGKDSFAWQWRFKFDNGFGASVIKHFGSYGFEDDLFELGILKWTGEYHDSHSYGGGSRCGYDRNRYPHDKRR